LIDQQYKGRMQVFVEFAGIEPVTLNTLYLFDIIE